MSKCSLFCKFVLFHCIMMVNVNGSPLADRSIADISGFKGLEELETYEEINGTEAFERAYLFDQVFLQFSCESKLPGFYADPTYHCRVFYVCEDNSLGYPVICPDGNSFDQRQRVCTDEPSIECEHAVDWFPSSESAGHSMEMTIAPRAESNEFVDEVEIPTVLPLVPL